MPKAMLLGRVQAKCRMPVGFLVGILKVEGTVATSSTRVNVLAEEDRKPLNANPRVLVLSILKWESGT